MNIKKRIFIPMITLTFVSCVAVLVSSIALYRSELNDAMHKQIEIAMNVVERELSDIRTQVRLAAIGMSSNNELTDAILNNDRDKVIELVAGLEAMVNLDYCTVIDNKGEVIFRTNDAEIYGDDVSHLPHVKEAFQGEIGVHIFRGVTVRLGMSAGAPIYDAERNIIGVISAGRRLDTEDIADKLKQLTESEITIFCDDERISSTIRTDVGASVIGTRADERISERVLAGEHLITRIDLFGKDMLAKYSPLNGVDDAVVGMVFVGYYTAEDSEKISAFIINGALITLAVLSVCLIIARIISGTIDLRLINMMNEIHDAHNAAEAASRAKSTFLANMSHEIRTPMNSIVGFSELALDDHITPKTKGYLNKITENSRWLLQIINDILDISKIESGKMELESVPFDMCEILSACQTIVSPKANEKGLELHFFSEPGTGKMPLGDPTRLLQVLVNLLSNAVRFTDSGIINLNAVNRDIGDSSITVLFEVIDGGIGMTPEQIERIFDPFTQAESGTTRKYGGTGLGLTIATNIVAMMGGTLFVDSTPGVGSTFSFELTFATTESVRDDMRKNVSGELEKPSFKGEVLLCEDNAMNQLVICEHLARVGLRTVVAENGKIGVEMVQSRKEKGEKQFDLVFMDMHMPVMDGLEATKRILELNTGIPVVAMTANIMSNDRELYEMNGMSDYVGKPFTSQELWRCLLRFFTPIDSQTDDKTWNDRLDDKLQQKLINGFVSSNQGMICEIKDALESGDLKLAHRLAHTLKGSAAQLRFAALSHAAGEVERSLKDGENRVTSQQLEILEKELCSAISELAPKVSEPTSQVVSEPINSADVARMLSELRLLLMESDPECLEYIENLRSIPGSEEIILRMEDFDFVSALNVLNEMDISPPTS